MIDSAKYLGLPSAPLRVARSRGHQQEGDDGRIVDAVREQFGRLQDCAQTMLGLGRRRGARRPPPAVLKAGAKPAPAAAVQDAPKGPKRLSRPSPSGPISSPAASRAKTPRHAISKLWQDGADDATFHRLWNDVQADISQGLNPGAALQNRIREAPGRAPAKADAARRAEGEPKLEMI